jgi:XTP/dITP diphosphohydrolase
MSALPSLERLVIASHNPGKVREIEALLVPFGIDCLSATALGLPEPEETGISFAENAAIKALAASSAARLPALADDSGLAVAALEGRPGIHSARWAGPQKDFRQAMAKVEEALAGGADRRAAFICNLCLAWPDGSTRSFEGRIEGALVWPPRGDRGFGYDPMFQPNGERLTFGEIEAARKHAMSHRAKAFQQLVSALSLSP